MHFSLGKLHNLIAARKYLCFLLNLNPKSTRTLWVLKKVCEALMVQESKNKQNNVLKEICEKGLREIYASKSFVKYN